MLLLIAAAARDGGQLGHSMALRLLWRLTIVESILPTETERVSDSEIGTEAWFEIVNCRLVVSPPITVPNDDDSTFNTTEGSAVHSIEYVNDRNVVEINNDAESIP